MRSVIYSVSMQLTLCLFAFFSNKERRFDVVGYEVLSLPFSGDQFQLFSHSELSEELRVTRA